MNSPKNGDKYLTAKKLMSALYGRLGMSPYMETLMVIESASHNTYLEKGVSNIIDLQNGKELISFLENDKNTDFKRKFNISIPIAMATTAYARIHMSKYKNLPGYKLYYTDTDSAFYDKPLPDYLVGDGLGQMRLENVLDEAVFIAPKVYGVKFQQ